MGTRLLSEHLIKKYHPQLRYVRVHTSGRNKATLYAWNDQLQLPDSELSALRKFAFGYLPTYVCYQIKEYSMLQTDNVPPIDELPERIVETAMNRNLDHFGVVGAINEMFPDGELKFTSYDLNAGTLYFDLRTSCTVIDIEKELILRYLYEVVPIGSICKVTYKEMELQK